MASTNDLTTRLRAMSRYAHDDLSIGDEAADVIERLRSDVHSCHSDCSRAGCVNGRLREEIERMRPEVERLIDRVERLRGLCKTAVGMLRDAGRDADAELIHGLIGDMEDGALRQHGAGLPGALRDQGVSAR